MTRNIKGIIFSIVLGIATFGTIHTVAEYEANKYAEKEMDEFEAKHDQTMKEMAQTLAKQMAYQYRIDNVLKYDYAVMRDEPYYNYSSEYLEWQDRMDPIYGRTSQNDYDGFLYTESGVNNDDKEFCKQYLDYINPQIIELLKELGWKVVLTNDNLATECGYEEDSNVVTYGVTYRNMKEIRIQADEQSIGKATLHEIGHAVCETWLLDVFEKNGYTDYDSKDFATIALHTENRRYVYEIKDELIAQLFVEYCECPFELETQSQVIYDIYNNIPQIAARQNIEKGDI